jgi:hypothetical protein
MSVAKLALSERRPSIVDISSDHGGASTAPLFTAFYRSLSSSSPRVV